MPAIRLTRRKPYALCGEWRGDRVGAGGRALAVPKLLPPRRRPGPSWKGCSNGPQPQSATSPNWAPASAGVVLDEYSKDVVLSILPRQGEVAPKATEGEDTEQRFFLTSPSVSPNGLPPPPSGGGSVPPQTARASSAAAACAISPPMMSATGSSRLTMPTDWPAITEPCSTSPSITARRSAPAQ